MAVTSRMLRRQLVEMPSAVSCNMWMCGSTRSRHQRKAAPNRRPDTMGTKVRRPRCAASSSAGCNRPKKAAASIMPPAPPNRQSMARRENSRRVKMSAAPRLTDSQESSPATRAWKTGWEAIVMDSP